MDNFHFSLLPQEHLLSNFPKDQNYSTLHGEKMPHHRNRT